ncbi:MAG: pyrroline-5-carboxylate reductase [Myxococcota bacterium]
MPKRVGTLGAGNMAEAILRGLLRAGLPAECLLASDPLEARRRWIHEELGIPTTESNVELAQSCDAVVLAVKPAQLEAATRDLPRENGPLYVSIVAGCRLATLEHLLGSGARIARAMPNTPALVGAGITGLCCPSQLTERDRSWAATVLGAVGRVVSLPESLMDAVTGLSGSGPAYVFLLIEALGEAGVREGLPPEIARELAVETVLGAARLCRETSEHPALLRERVTSPGGTTAAGLAALERAGLRGAVLDAVHAATLRSRELAGA